MPGRFSLSSILRKKSDLTGSHVEAPESELLQEEVQQLKRAVEELSVLNELARAIGSSYDYEEIMQTLIRSSLRAVSAEQASITPVDPKTHSLGSTLVRSIVNRNEQGSIHLDPNLLGKVLLEETPCLSNDPARDPELEGIELDESIRSILCVPLRIKSQVTGILAAYNKKGEGDFTEEDQRLLSIIASQSAQVLENARLYEEERAYLQVQEQIRLAREIQLGLLPKSPPVIAGYDISGTSIPAQEIGGDYFDWIPMGKDHWGLCLADVSGKGLPASLLMANLQATLRALALSCNSAGDCVSRVNEILYQNTDAEKFATLAYGILDAVVHSLEYCIAGHESPLLFSSTLDSPENPARLSTRGTLVGVMPDFEFQTGHVPIKPGDLLVFYSDGITDAENEQEERFGIERLVSLIEKVKDGSAAAIMESVVDAVRKHASEAHQLDDISLMIVKRDGRNGT